VKGEGKQIHRRGKASVRLASLHNDLLSSNSSNPESTAGGQGPDSIHTPPLLNTTAWGIKFQQEFLRDKPQPNYSIMKSNIKPWDGVMNFL
jgi:hypothetical protein